MKRAKRDRERFVEISLFKNIEIISTYRPSNRKYSCASVLLASPSGGLKYYVNRRGNITKRVYYNISSTNTATRRVSVSCEFLNR